MPQLTHRARFYVLDRETGDCRYQAPTLSQAKGFADGIDEPCRIVAGVDSFAAELHYQISLVDESTGQVVAYGPTIDLFDAPELLCNLKIVLLPVATTGAD